MRKFSALLMVMIMACFALTACTHNTGNNSIDNNSTGNNGGDEDTGTYYTVTFDSNGGSSVQSQKVRDGNPAVRPQTPVREGYYLTGWFRHDETEWNFDTDRVNADVTLYAGWNFEQSLPDSTPSLTFVKDGNAYTVTDVGEETVVVIPAEYDGLPVTKIQGHHGTGAFAQKAITSVVIPDTVTEIGQNTFYGCSALSAVSIGENSALTAIGNNAFTGCSALKSMTIPAGVTTIGDMAFNNCAALESFAVAGGNTAYRSENGHLIDNATNTLIRGVADSVVPESVTSIAQAAFRRTSGITELYIPKTVTAIGSYFIADSTITKLIYAGTEAEWNAIQKSASMWNYGNRDVQLVFGGSAPEPETPPSPKVLVAYFSCTNNTRRVAEAIHAELSGSHVYEITPAVPYTTADLDYNTDCRANREQNDATARPEISGSVENIAQYDVIFIGYPIWWGQAPKIIYTFLGSYDFSGKTIIPFCTSGGSGMGSSATNLHGLAPNANWKSGARISGDNVGSLISQMD